MKIDQRTIRLGLSKSWLPGQVPDGVDRRAFLMRSALIGATAVLTGRPVSAQESANRLKAGISADAAAFPNAECREGAEGPGD